ncbi:MAG TPA: type II secretion system F family protein [Acidimicrobiia bacterium]|nr:type II secretion system F family protein [Acidimicrobiia bacterium]
MIPLGAGVGGWWFGRRAGWHRPALAATAAAAVVVEPLLGSAGIAVLVAADRWRRAARETVRLRTADEDVVLFADLVVLGVSAGLSLRAAVEEAGRHVVVELQEEVNDVVRSMDRSGVAAALAGVDGRLADFGRVAAGAAISGAPVAAAIGSFAATVRQTEHTAAIERARRLPVRMLLPLALLILPGFVVLAVGPAVIQSLARLGPIP